MAGPHGDDAGRWTSCGVRPKGSRTMAKAKARQKSPFEGLWHIVSMSGWDEDYFNEEVQAFIEFEANGTGHFQFGYVQGYMDWRPGTRDGQPAVEWTWEGTDGADMTRNRTRPGCSSDACPSLSRPGHGKGIDPQRGEE